MAAGGIDVVTFFDAEGGDDTGAFEGFGEGAALVFRGAGPLQTFDGVVGDEVDLGVEASGEGGEGLDVGRGVVDAGDEDVFQGDHLALAIQVLLAGGGEVGEGMLAVDRHDLVADGVGGTVKGDGESELFRFVGELPDLWGEAGGGDGDLAGPDVGAPRGVEGTEGDEQVVVIGEGFAHSHDDEVVDETLRGGLGRRGGGRGSGRGG